MYSGVAAEPYSGEFPYSGAADGPKSAKCKSSGAESRKFSKSDFGGCPRASRKLAQKGMFGTYLVSSWPGNQKLIPEDENLDTLGCSWAMKFRFTYSGAAARP